jgi:anti-sigma regulatory factor (Ser/Thr protein kinase)
MTMAVAAAKTMPLISLTLASIPSSVRVARFYVRSAFAHHNLGGFAADAEAVTSELVTNAIEHAGAATFGLEVVRLAESGMVAVIVSDCSPHPPVRHDPAEDTEHGRGLNIVEALSVEWGWRPKAPGKAVHAILGGEAK